MMPSFKTLFLLKIRSVCIVDGTPRCARNATCRSYENSKWWWWGWLDATVAVEASNLVDIVVSLGIVNSFIENELFLPTRMFHMNPSNCIVKEKRTKIITIMAVLNISCEKFGEFNKFVRVQFLFFFTFVAKYFYFYYYQRTFASCSLTIKSLKIL